MLSLSVCWKFDRNIVLNNVKKMVRLKIFFFFSKIPWCIVTVCELTINVKVFKKKVVFIFLTIMRPNFKKCRIHQLQHRKPNSNPYWRTASTLYLMTRLENPSEATRLRASFPKNYLKATRYCGHKELCVFVFFKRGCN